MPLLNHFFQFLALLATDDGGSSSSIDPATTTTSSGSIINNELTTSTFWLLGVLISICLVLLALMGILVGRYRWWRHRLSVFYAGSEGAFSDYAAQYLLRLSYDRDPTRVAPPSRHTDDCQVWLRLWYEHGPRGGLSVPLVINKIYQFNDQPTSQVLLRARNPITNARSISAQISCARGCPARRRAAATTNNKPNSRSRSSSGEPPPRLSLDDRLFADLKPVTASFQSVPSRFSLSTKVLVLGAEPRSYFILSGGGGSKKRVIMEHERTYSLAIESRQQIDYHPLRAAVTCPSDALVVFNYLAAGLTFLLLAAGEVQFQMTGTSNSGGHWWWAWTLLLVTLPPLVGALFLLSGHYLFVTLLQDRLIIRSLGRSTGAWLLHFGLLTFLTLCGLISCLGAVTLITAGVEIGVDYNSDADQDVSSTTIKQSVKVAVDILNSTTPTEDSTSSSSSSSSPAIPKHVTTASFETFFLVGLAWAVLFSIEGVLALLDHCFGCFNGVLSGSSFCTCFGDDSEKTCPRLPNAQQTKSAAAAEEYFRRRKSGRKGKGGGVGGKRGGCGKKARGRRKGKNISSK